MLRVVEASQRSEESCVLKECESCPELRALSGTMYIYH
jgi:hypothetical protein